MFVDHPVAIVGVERWAVSQNYTRGRFKTLLCEPDESFEKSGSMVIRSCREVDEHDRVARFAVAAPCTVCGEFLKCGGDFQRITSNIEPHPLKDSSDHTADVG